VSSPSSALGFVPNSNGDSVELISPWYDLRNYEYAFLQFSHICKTSTSDMCQIKYQELSMPGWKVIPTSSYQGNTPSAYAGAKFSHASYSTWIPNDSLATPSNSWWKEENFDVSGEVSYAQVRFKFVIVKGNVLGSQFAYGWVIDNFKLLASANPIKPPIVEFLSSSPVDTVYNTGPFTVKAKIVSQTFARIVQPVKLNVSYTYNNITTYDTLTMTMIEGDSIFSAIIPQKVFGTTITYDVRGVDSVGNDATAFSSFYIKRAIGGAATGYVTAGTGNITQTYSPFYRYYDYGWSRNLYLGNELSQSGGGGLITKLGWHVSTTGVSGSNQTCYFQAVNDNSITSNAWIDPSTSGATQVWTGTFNPSTTGWVEINLDNPFMLPPGQNLLIYWTNYNGSYTSPYAYWTSTSTSPVYRSVYKYQDGSFPASAGTYNYNRPNARFYIVGGSDDTNSVALFRIDNPTDSVVAAPAYQVPVVVTIKNKGMGDLDSCYIDWNLNGVSQPRYTWHGHLPDDFNSTDTIGFYTPSVNLYDTLIIWTSMPNGVYDSTTFDDTLMRVAFGVPDLAMGFTIDLGDTAYNTGPFEVVAEIYSRMGATTPSPINLDVIYRNDTTYTYDTLLMTSMGNNLYRTYIPQHIFGTDIRYSITLIDTLGNIVTIRDSVYLKRSGSASTNDSIQIGSSLGGGDCSYPFTVSGDGNNWSRALYLSSAIGNTTQQKTISGLAYYNSYSGVTITRYNTQCYLKATSLTDVNGSCVYNNPITDGATRVYRGTWTTVDGWNKFTFNVPFVLPAGSNLMVYWIDTSAQNMCNNLGGMIFWSVNSVGYTCSDRQYTNFACVNTGCGSTSSLPTTIVYFGSIITDSNSVALHEIVSPNVSVTAGQTTPVIATIKNKGIANLTSCNINWTLNGVLQPTVNWTGNLPEDFNSTDTIGSYIPRNSMFDTIKIWVSDPNGAYDSIHYDDTLEIITFGCGQVFSGDVIVGADTSTADFASLQDMIAAINLCGSSGSVTVKLQSGTYAENISIPDLSASMGTDTLFITSLAGNADSVIFQVSSGVALALNNAKNVYISHITWDASLGTYGVQLIGTGDNIEIYGCNIKASPTTTSSSNVGVYYGNSSGSGKYMTNVRFIKNAISGGYYNMYFYYSGSGTATMGLSSITIDSNTLTDAYYYGIYSYYYGNYPSISHNSITSRLTSVSYYGIYSYYYHNILELVGNRIKVTGSSMCYGMYLYYYQNYSASYGSTGPGLLANNEIIVLGGSSTSYGIYMYGNSRWDMTHNTIFVQGNSTCYGLYRYNSSTGYPMNVNKNILTTHTSSTGYPLYISSTTYAPVAYGSINYNNYYSNGAYIAYVGSAISTIAALKTATTQDTNSINVYPNFIDSTSNLDLVDYTGFDCPQDPAVLDDINGYPRLSTTTIGAHCLMLVNVNANMKEVVGWETQAMVGRNFGVNAVLENLGLVNLTSATINWSFNDVLQTPVNWTGSLATGQSANVYLGNITFMQGDSNNLVIWVTNPNNTTDMFPANDTLRLSTFGGAGVLVEFISPFLVDTLVGNTGPYEINARVKSLSQQPLATPVLNVYTLWQGTPSYTNITMTSVSGDSLWKATIPQQAYGSHVEYSITAYDSLGTMVTDTLWFYVKRGASGGAIGTIVVGDTTSGTGNLGKWFHINATHSWSRNLYYHTELNTTLTGGTILKFAMYNKNYNLIYTRANQKIYMMAVDSMLLTYNAYIDPSTIGATLVWTGGITTQLYWNEVTLQTPFNLPPNKNLLVYFVDE
ncbi:MAG TPA: hypothetical protein PLP76_10015, partial [Bacteroidales bacterium]|nr:hypothetical protein [Bacteroidales bacterium]